MDKKIQHGYILLADISGFDAYITKVELNHAKGVVKELLELIVEGLTPPLTLASLEGDAVLTFADEKKIPQSNLLVGLLEATYVEFRDRLVSIQRNNSCDCRACKDAPMLDLKFFVHYGEFSIQSVEGGTLELGGLDAKLVRERLLKDQVENENRNGAYVLFTETSLERMGIRSNGMMKNTRSYPHLGEITTTRLDLRSSYEEVRSTRRATISEGAGILSFSFDFPVSSSTLWMWLNNPEKRTLWMKWRSWRAGKRPWGRNGVGAENHCAHGLGTMIETILAWKPYKSFTIQSRQDSINFSMVQTFQLEPVPDGEGTQLKIHTEIKNAGLFTFSQVLLKKGLERLWKMDYQLLLKMIVEEGVHAGQPEVVP
jgi:hypothetical protein